jgi:hypothetical protein
MSMPLRVVVWGALALLAGCSTPPAALRADTLAYLQKMASWAPTEAETARTLERILATEFVDEAEVLRQIADNMPRAQRQLNEAEAYRPRTHEIRRINESYIAGWRALLEGYKDIIAGFQTGEQAKLADGRRAMGRWRDAILGVARDLRALRRRLDLESGQPAALPSHPSRPEAQEPGAVRPRRALRRRSGGVLLSHMATMQYHRRWRA